MTEATAPAADLHRTILEERLATYTARLAELTDSGMQPDRGGYDQDTLAGLISSARQAVEETTHALRRLDDGTYGRCERCGQDIPAERLEIRPTTRFCVPCQQR